MSSLDHYTDKGALFVKLFNSRPLPDFVKEASVDEADQISSLPADAFADMDNRAFPIHTAADAFVSAAYFYSQPKVASNAQVESRLKKAAGIWGFNISEPYEAASSFLGKKSKCPAKTASEASLGPRPDNFCQTSEGRVYGIFTKEAAELSQEDFLANFRQHAFEDRYKIAAHIIDNCRYYGAKVEEDTYKFAGAGFPDMEVLKAHIDGRALAIGDLKKQAALFEWSQGIVDAPEKDYSALHKLAVLLNEFDHENGLDRFYGRRFADPHRTVYNHSIEKVASVVESVKINGKEFLVQDIPAKDSELYRIALGSRYQETFGKAASLQEGVLLLSDKERLALVQYLS